MKNKKTIERREIMLRFGLYGNPTVNQKYYLPNDLVIASAILRGVQSYVTNTPVPTQDEIKKTFTIGISNNPIYIAQLKACYLTLCNDKGEEIYKDLPLYTYSARVNNGIIRNHFNQRINPAKSYVKFMDVSGISNQLSYLLIAFYILK